MDKHLLARIDSLTREIARLTRELERSRQAEAVLRESEQRYHSIFDEASVGLAQYDLDGRFLEVNRPFCSILGYSRAELLGKRYLDVTHPDDRGAEQEHRRRLIAGEIPRLSLEKRYVRKDGTIVWACLNFTLIRKADGQPGYLLAVIENISERRALEDSLRRIASNLARADLMALAGTWTWKIDSGETTASAEVLQLFGLPPDRPTLPFELFLERIVPEDRETVLAALHAALAEQKPYQIEYRLRLPDGRERLVLAGGEIYSRDEAGKPVVMIGMVQDVTARRAAEHALRESEQLFRQLFDNAVDGIFIADKNGKYLDVNLSGCRMLGYARDELVGKHIVDLIPEQDRERLAESRTFLLQNADHSQTAEWTLKSRQGEYLPVELSTRILPDGRWMAMVRDISERKRIQAELERYAAEVRDLYENAPCGYHSLDADGMFIRINKTELDWLGYAADELIGKKHVTDLLTEQSRQQFRENFPAFLKTGRLRDLELQMVRKDGSILPVLVSATAAFDEQGRLLHSRTSLFDISALAEAQKKLRQAATVFEHTSDAIIITDGDGIIVAVNKAFTRITGYQPEDVIGKNPRLLQSGRQDGDFYRALWRALEQSGTWQGEIWDRKKFGEIFPAWETITAVRDASGKITDYVSVFSDITTIKATEEKLVRLAYHDALTGLPNRLLFNDRMAQALAHAKRHGKRAALMLLDLDRFKLINDTLGHAAGDQLLQIVSARLKQTIREEDTVARLGGDEFAVILNEVADTDSVGLLAQKLTRLISQPLQLDNHVLTVSTSIGIGIYPDDADNPAALSKAADLALYGAKDKGRNAHEFYTPEMTRATTETLLIDRGLRRALARGELALLYQPQIDLATGRIVGLEALLRWNDPAQGGSSPDRFIPVAEETDLIEAIDDWVLDRAWEQLQRWRSLGMPPVRLAVNMSVRQIKKPGLVEGIRRRMRGDAAGGGFVMELEVTETALQTEADTVAALKDLKTLGVKIAIDDFGTGYSSLNSLKHLPIDMLKIDRTFIHGLPLDPDDSSITSAIIAMGHKLGMDVIAEGVETVEQLRFLRQHRCDYVQGFLFFPPLPADECEQILLRGAPLELGPAGLCIDRPGN